MFEYEIKSDGSPSAVGIVKMAGMSVWATNLVASGSREAELLALRQGFALHLADVLSRPRTARSPDRRSAASTTTTPGGDMAHEIVFQPVGANDRFRRITTKVRLRGADEGLTDDGVRLLDALRRIDGLNVRESGDDPWSLTVSSSSLVLWPWSDLEVAVAAAYGEVFGWDPSEVVVRLEGFGGSASVREYGLADDE